MAPSTTDTTFEPIVAASAANHSPQPIAKTNGNSSPPASTIPTQTAPKTSPTAAPTYEQKDFREILSYEDKWIGWDGPVWCSRYGQFENKEQAAADDGYKSNSPVAHRGTHYSPFQLRLYSIPMKLMMLSQTRQPRNSTNPSSKVAPAEYPPSINPMSKISRDVLSQWPQAS